MHLRLYQSLQEEISTYNRNLLEQVTQNVGQVVFDLLQSCNSLRFENTFHADISRMENQLAVVNALAQQSQENPYIRQGYLLYPGSDTAFCSRGAYATGSLLTGILHLPAGEVDNFLRMVRGTDSPRFITVETLFETGSTEFRREKLLFIYPVRNLSNALSAHLVVEINEPRFTQVLSLGSGEFGQIYMVNGLFRQVSGSNSLPMPPAYLQAVEEGIQDGSLAHIQLKKGVYASCQAFSNADLYLVNVVDTTPLFLLTLHRNRGTLVAILLLLVCGLATAAAVAFQYYRPIRLLSEHVGDDAGSGGQENEISYIREQFDKVNAMRLNFARDLERQWPLVEERMVTELLYHGTFELQENDMVYHIVHRQMEGRHCLVLCITPLDRSGRLRTLVGQEQNAVSAALDGAYLAYSTYLFYYQALVALLLFDGQPAAGELEALEKRVQAYFERQLDCKVVLASGQVYPSIRDVRSSFLEAVALMQRQLDNPGDATPMETESMEALFRYEAAYEKQLAELCYKMCSGEGDAAAAAIGRLQETLEALEAPEHAMQMVYCNILNTVIHTASRIEGVSCGEEWFHVTSFTSPKVFAGSLLRPISAICDAVCVLRESSRSQLEDSISSYLDQNLLDSELSLSALSDHLNLSQSYLSKYITQHFGLSFSDIVTNRRMEYVKAELAGTEKPVSQIAREAGYTSISNFIRRFKLLEGITPGQYRELNITVRQ